MKLAGVMVSTCFLAACIPTMGGDALKSVVPSAPPSNTTTNNTEDQSKNVGPAPVMMMCSPGATCTIVSNEGGDVKVPKPEGKAGGGVLPSASSRSEQVAAVQEADAPPAPMPPPPPSTETPIQKLLTDFGNNFAESEIKEIAKNQCPCPPLGGGKGTRGWKRSDLKEIWEDRYTDHGRETILDNLCGCGDK